MPHSSASLPICRLEWRPSRLEQAALLLLTLLAACSLLECELPSHLAWPGVAGVLGVGAICIWRNARRSRQMWVLMPTLTDCRVDGAPLARLELRWRGALLFMRWKPPGQRRWQYTVWWPDRLSARQRRALRLVMPIRPAAPPVMSTP